MKFADTNWSFWLKHQTLKQRSLCPWFFWVEFLPDFCLKKFKKVREKSKNSRKLQILWFIKKSFIKFEMTNIQMISSFLSEVKQARKKKSTFQNTISMQTWFFLMQLVWENERFSSSFSTSYRKSKYILIFLKNYTLLVRWWQNFSFKSCSINMLVIFFFKSLTNYDLSLPSPFGPKLQLRGLLGLESGFG